MTVVSKLLGLTRRRKTYVSMQADAQPSISSEKYNSPIYIQDARLCNTTKVSNKLDTISEDRLSAVVVSNSIEDMGAKTVLTHTNMAIPCRKGYYVQYKKGDQVVVGKYKVESRRAPDLIVTADKNGIVAYNPDDMEMLYQYPWSSIENIRHEDNLQRTPSKSKALKNFMGVHRKDGGVFVIESEHIGDLKNEIFAHHTTPGSLKWIETNVDATAHAHEYMHI